MSDITNQRKLLDHLLRDKSVEHLLYDFLMCGGGEITFKRTDNAINAVIYGERSTKQYGNVEGTSQYAVREAMLTVIADYLINHPITKE